MNSSLWNCLIPTFSSPMSLSCNFTSTALGITTARRLSQCLCKAHSLPIIDSLYNVLSRKCRTGWSFLRTVIGLIWVPQKYATCGMGSSSRYVSFISRNLRKFPPESLKVENGHSYASEAIYTPVHRSRRRCRAKAQKKNWIAPPSIVMWRFHSIDNGQMHVLPRCLFVECTVEDFGCHFVNIVHPFQRPCKTSIRQVWRGHEV